MNGKDDKDFLIRVKADINKATADLKKVAGQMKKTGDQGKKSSAGVDKMGKSMNQLITVAKIYIALRLARSVLLQADAFNVLQTRVKTATKNTGDYVQVSRELYDITQRNGAALNTTVSLFQSIARAAPELGASNKEVLTLVNTVEQLGIISGASKANLQAGLLQFSQGLSSGIFRAEEFNSLLENIPEVANRIAEGMGLTVGQLRQAVVDGNVLSKDVFDSLLKQSEDISKQFKDIPDSIERSETRFIDSWSRMLDAVDDKLKFTDLYKLLVNQGANAFNFLSDNLDEVDAGKFNSQISSAVDHVTKLVSKIDDLKRSDIKNAINLIDDNITAIGDRLSEIKNLESGVSFTIGSDGSGTIDQLTAAIENLRAQREKLIDALNGSNNNGSAEGLSKDAEKSVQAINKIIDALQAQIDTFGLTNEEMAIYQLHLQGASIDELSLAASLVRRIKAMDDAKKAQEEGQKVFEETRYEHEKLEAEIERLNELLHKGAIDWDTYNRAIALVETSLDELAGSDVWDELTDSVEGWGRETAAALADMTQTGDDLWRELANSIINQILRILYYQALIQPLLASFGFTGTGGTGGGGIGGGVSGPVGIAHSGGIAGQSGVTRTMPLSVFSNAPRFHNGRIPGLRSNEIPTILEDDEEVLTSNNPRHINNLGKGSEQNVKIEVTNKGGGKQAADVSVDRQGRDLVVGVILDDVESGGPISRSYQKTFKLNRTGG